MTPALETIGLEKQFGGLKVTRDLSLRIREGARHALIGPNGAGKTTVINLLTGVLKPNAGRILLEGHDITGLPVHSRALRGLSRTFQINQLYADLTPLETIGLAVSERLGRGSDWWRRMGTRDDVNGEIAENLARFLRVKVAVFLRDYTVETEDEGRVLKRDKDGCIFLDGNLCSVYEARPNTCELFPHLVKGNGSLLSRMWHMPDRAVYCPIVYNTLEDWKVETGFKK